MFFRLHQHLLPRAAAWKIVISKRLRSFFEGLSEWPADFRDFVDLVYEDLRPETTRELAAWEEQFGIYASTVEANRRAAVRAEWLANGGQGLDYLQSVIQAVDHSVYVYGPWIDFATELPALRPLLWLRGDDPGATVDVGSCYVTVPNRGTLSGNATSASGSGPQRVEVDGKFAALTTANGGFQFGTTSSLSLLHAPTGDATVVFRLQFDSTTPATGGWILTTRNGSATSRGVTAYHETNGRVYLEVSDGTAFRVTLSNPSVTPVGQHTLAIRKTGLFYELLQDGTVVASGTAASLIAGDSAVVPQICGRTTDINRFTGSFLEGAIFPYAVSNAKLAQFTEILERWNGGTGFVPRDPRQYVNQPLVGTVQCGEALAQCGEDTAQANAFLANETHYLVNKDLTGNAPPAIPADPATWPFFVYLAGPGGPDDVFFLDEAKRRELERQALKIRPLENWIVMRDVGAGYLITDDDGFLSVDANGFLETT